MIAVTTEGESTFQGKGSDTGRGQEACFFSICCDIIAARSETFEQPFYEYSIPEAITTFRQGFGRLIRSRQDKGVVVMFDNRVMTKQYGKMFIDSLPPCTVEVGPIEDIPKKAVEWLGF